MKSSLFPALLALVALPGCINVSRTTVRDEPRSAVNFASDRAASVFYEAFSRRPDATERTVESSSVSLILINSHQRVVEGPNRAFNAAVAIADANHDGTISEPEATGYAALIGSGPAAPRTAVLTGA